MRKLLKNQYVVSLATKVFIVLLGLLISIFINRYLGPSLKGEYSYILNIINILVLILNLGIYQSYPFYKRSDEEECKSKFFSIVIIQFLLYLTIAIILSIALKKIEYTLMLTLTPIMILRRQLNFIGLVENINKRNLLNIGNQIFYTLLLFLIYTLMLTNLYYVFIAMYLKDIIIIIRIIYKYNLKLQLKNLDAKLASSAIKFGIFPMLAALLTTANYSLDVIILKHFMNYREIGYYTVGVGLANKVWLISDAFKEVLFSKTAKKDSIFDVKLSLKINLYISIVLIIFIIVFGQAVIQTLYGTEYLPAYSVTSVIFIGLIPMIFFKLINPLFVANGRQKESFIYLLIAVTFNIGMNLVLIPKMGIVGAALASVVSYTICGGLFLLSFIRSFSLKWKEVFIFEKSELEIIKNKLLSKK